MDKYNHLTTENTVADVVNNRAFKGFGQYILPLEWRYDPEMKLRNIPSLLPYHNYVDASRAVGYINDMIDMVARGNKLYYPLGRKDAGLFFFPGRPTETPSAYSYPPQQGKEGGDEKRRNSRRKDLPQSLSS